MTAPRRSAKAPTSGTPKPQPKPKTSEPAAAAKAEQPTKRRVPNSKRDWIEAFLAVLRDTGNVRAATQAAQIDRSTPYKLKATDKAFAEAWDAAMDDAADVLEAEARRRAIIGVDEPVFYQGAVVGTVKHYSDSLLMFLLKGVRPQTYREHLSITTEVDPARDRVLAKIDELAARREQRSS